MADSKIAVFRPGALGDLVLAVPVLDALIRAHEEAGARLDLHVFATMPHGSVLRAGEAAWGRMEVRDFGGRDCAWLFGGSGPAPAMLEESVGGADAVIAWLNDPDGAFRERLVALGARLIVAHPSKPHPAACDAGGVEPARPVHASEHLWRALLEISRLASPIAGTGRMPGPLARLRFPPFPPVPTIESPSLRARDAELRAGMARLAIIFPDASDGGLAAIHPGSGGAAKRAPPELFAAIARAAAAFDLRSFLICGPADAGAVDAVQRAVLAGASTHDSVHVAYRTVHFDAAPDSGRVQTATGTERLPVLYDPPLRELAAILTSCDVYVGNDSGVTHLAAAMGVPTLAFFGPTDPSVWSPRGLSARVVRFRSDGGTVRVFPEAVSAAASLPAGLPPAPPGVPPILDALLNAIAG